MILQCGEFLKGHLEAAVARDNDLLFVGVQVGSGDGRAEGVAGWGGVGWGEMK